MKETMKLQPIEADCWMSGQCWMTMTPNNIRLEVKTLISFAPGRRIVSKAFNVQYFFLEVQVYPNGGEEDQKGRVSVFLNNLPDRQVYIAASVKFLGSECSFKQPTNSGSGYGWDLFINHNDAKFSGIVIDHQAY